MQQHTICVMLLLMKITGGKGIGKDLIKKITEDSRYSGMVGLLLTKDAHGLYKQYGFNEEATRFMIKMKL